MVNFAGLFYYYYFIFLNLFKWFSIVFNQDLLQHLFVSFVLLYFICNLVLATALIIHLVLILHFFVLFCLEGY